MHTCVRNRDKCTFIIYIQIPLYSALFPLNLLWTTYSVYTHSFSSYFPMASEYSILWIYSANSCWWKWHWTWFIRIIKTTNILVHIFFTSAQFLMINSEKWNHFKWHSHLILLNQIYADIIYKQNTLILSVQSNEFWQMHFDKYTCVTITTIKI